MPPHGRPRNSRRNSGHGESQFGQEHFTGALFDKEAPVKEERANTSKTVAHFYDQYGWVRQTTGAQGEDQLFRSFPKAQARYAEQLRERVCGLFGGKRDALLFAGCGDMPESHMRVAQLFKTVTCMDISTTALDIAQAKLGRGASYVHESIVNTTLPDNMFDTVFCAHVLFHINKDEQETAVRQLLRVTKPGGRLCISYANPNSPFAIPGESVRRVKGWLGYGRQTSDAIPALYYFAHPLHWWQRFAGECKLSLVPSDVIGSRPARAMLRSEQMASFFYQWAARIETRAPRVAARLWQYVIVVLEKA